MARLHAKRVAGRTTRMSLGTIPYTDTSTTIGTIIRMATITGMPLRVFEAGRRRTTRRVAVPEG